MIMPSSRSFVGMWPKLLRLRIELRKAGCTIDHKITSMQIIFFAAILSGAQVCKSTTMQATEKPTHEIRVGWYL